MLLLNWLRVDKETEVLGFLIGLGRLEQGLRTAHLLFNGALLVAVEHHAVAAVLVLFIALRVHVPKLINCALGRLLLHLARVRSTHSRDLLTHELLIR